MRGPSIPSTAVVWSGSQLPSFRTVRRELTAALLEAPRVEVGEWQAIRDASHPMAVTYELRNVQFEIYVPPLDTMLAEDVQPNLPWAEIHFQERVSGVPVNPPPSHELWPFAQQDNSEHRKDGKFSHTYPERFWPKWAGDGGRAQFRDTPYARDYVLMGVRYKCGDLLDVVKMLAASPGTRQAYLPVWFPEDTGAVHGERVPCTLGYLFQIREGRMSCTYHIRSCDFVRHWRDDVYMAARLLQWMCTSVKMLNGKLCDVVPSSLTMCVGSMHVFEGDQLKLRQDLAELLNEEASKW